MPLITDDKTKIGHLDTVKFKTGTMKLNLPTELKTTNRYQVFLQNNGFSAKFNVRNFNEFWYRIEPLASNSATSQNPKSYRQG